MKKNVIFVSVLILCVSILIGLKVVEKFTNPQTTNPLTYGDYMHFFKLAERATEIDKESARLGLIPEPMSNRMAPNAKSAIERIMKYVPNDRAKLDIMKKQIQNTKKWICLTPEFLHKQLEENSKASNAYDSNNMKWRTETLRKIDTLNSPDAAKYKELCSIDV
jgi:hypothetical protein